ncbi:MAG: hypothetical protein M3032_02755 [Verrucomicrobiota bacterium]|nr:hypothetical protein [Verrucomicrobiota bacterium]
MSGDLRGDAPQPSRARVIVAALVVALIVLAVWAFIEYRSQPPPPPNPVRGVSAKP